MSESKNAPIDKDLNDLLDSALQDFDKVKISCNSKRRSSSTSGNDPQSVANAENSEGKGDDSNKTSELAESSIQDAERFFMEQAKIMSERMSKMFGEDNSHDGENAASLPQDPDQLMAGFKKMAEAAALTIQGDSTASDEEVAKYSNSIAQALKGLQEGSDNLSASLSESDVMNMFSSFNMDNGNLEDSNAFLPFMEGMMQSLLSAELLLPSIKDLLERYSVYLEKNSDRLSVEEKERYEKQMHLYRVVEGHLENENPNDSPREKREKLRLILDDMRKLQECGQPPEEILAEATGDLPAFDVPPPLNGAGANNPQCPTM